MGKMYTLGCYHIIAAGRLPLSPPILQIRQITANEAVCLTVIVAVIITTLYSIYLAVDAAQ